MLDNSKGGVTSSFHENKENSFPDNHWNDSNLSKFYYFY